MYKIKNLFILTLVLGERRLEGGEYDWSSRKWSLDVHIIYSYFQVANRIFVTDARRTKKEAYLVGALNVRSPQTKF